MAKIPNPVLDKNYEKEDHSINNITKIGTFFWPIILSSGVFFGTLWTNQSLVTTRREFINSEIKQLSDADDNLNQKIEKLDSGQKTLLLDISTRLRDLEIKITELQVKIIYAIEQNSKAQQQKD